MTTSRLHPDDDRADHHGHTSVDDEAAHEVEDAFSTIFEKCKISSIGAGTTSDKHERPETGSGPSCTVVCVPNETDLENTHTENVDVTAKTVFSSQLSKESQVVLVAADMIGPEIQYVKCRSGDLISPEEVSVQRAEVHSAERWSDTASQMSPAPAEESEAVTCEPTSEMYYTASSEVSLLSDEVQERGEGVMAGHVAAMRERFENMTRANTPGPDPTDPTDPAHDYPDTAHAHSSDQ